MNNSVIKLIAIIAACVIAVVLLGVFATQDVMVYSMPKGE
jgi:hypothetical protein